MMSNHYTIIMLFPLSVKKKPDLKMYVVKLFNFNVLKPFKWFIGKATKADSWRNY